jgi:hypothetical protein
MSMSPKTPTEDAMQRSKLHDILGLSACTLLVCSLKRVSAAATGPALCNVT